MQHSARKLSTIITGDSQALTDSFAEDVDKGLSASPKYLPCVYFYDYHGSLLFEEICRLPEYYLTRAEAEILRTFAHEIISYMHPESSLVELGSGSCTKTQYIIDEMLKERDGIIYSPIDVSREMLKQSARSLLERYDNLKIISVAAEYEEGLSHIDTHTDEPKFILWLGSSIGNFEFSKAMNFLKGILRSLRPEDLILIGFDLEKDKGILEGAYNDSQGVTARFNMNLLARINRDLRAEFDLDRFNHHAIYNEAEHRIEMYLVSTCKQEVPIADLNRSYSFDKDEKIHTENSHKYSPEAIAALATEVGLSTVGQWSDSMEYFNLTLFRKRRR
jgi:dimethylhistidine N-methyltransferase